MNKIYAIIHKDAQEFQRFNNKTCWMSVAAAKSSFEADSYRNKCTKLVDNPEYELVELTEYYFRYKDLCK